MTSRPSIFSARADRTAPKHGHRIIDAYQCFGFSTLHTHEMAGRQERTKTRGHLLVWPALWLATAALSLAWLAAPSFGLPATHAVGPTTSIQTLVIPVQRHGDPGGWCPPGMSACDASVCCKKGWRCCRSGCCPPHLRWACDTKRKCYRTKRAALRDGCPPYAVSICIKPRWAD